MTTAIGSRLPAWLSSGDVERLEQRLERGLAQARRRGVTVLVSVSAECGEAVDPLALLAGSRSGDEPWFCFEQPDRDGAALAALGCVHELSVGGADRFEMVSRGWRELTATALSDPPGEAPGAGLAAFGGFAFAPAGGAAADWRGFSPASLQVPEVSVARHRGRTWLTLNAAVDGATDLAAERERIARRLAALRAVPLPLLDPSPVGRYEVRSLLAPSHYEEAVARAVQRIRAGELEKVVLAREVEVTAPDTPVPLAVLAVLREAFPTCFVFAVGRGEATFLGASPELLVRREGARAATVALAGSARRSADPAVDDHLGEQLLRSDKDRHENAIVAERIAQALAPHAVWVAAAPEPGLVKVANIQHLAAPIRAQLARPLDAVRLAGILHPTPAVGAEPRAAATTLIPALEGFDRGWYAGPVGWMDGAGDGEFCVALRCALLRGRQARLFAGAGIVAASDPAAELAETEVKLGALLPVLSG
jgi:salicylate biosynthesis isochorismate synthase/menaquinone-specific isochorismate synthase